ncbi:MAG: dicarboxylate/amino acid:cation symporter [Gammaproteobacteria bacterium]|nr:dicarboxylate/amino acid:cation symporter [Gammaproteobacteria bacterium]
MWGKYKSLDAHWKIMFSLLLAVIAGYIAGKDAAVFGVSFNQMFAFIGTLFLQALKMLIVPLVFSSIIVGVAGIGNGPDIGRLGGRTLLFYLLSSLLAIIVGLLVVNYVEPGILDGEAAKDKIGLQVETSSFSEKVEGRGAGDIVDVFLRMIPTNIVSAAANGQMLGLIFFSLLFGYFMSGISHDHALTQKHFWNGIFETMMKITDLVMRFAPLGVFGLVAKVVSDIDPAGNPEKFFNLIETLGLFALSVFSALLIHSLITLPLILKYVAGISNPFRHHRAMSPALLTAFSTASSSATLPVTMDCVEKNAGVSNKTSSFVLPLGATINMDGTALYECVAAIFIAQAYGLDLSFAQQFTIVLVALLTSIGVAGIPSASLVAITIILAAIGLPMEAVGLIIAVDRVLDMCRTSVNVFSDSCAAVVIAKFQGEKNILTK